MKQLTAFLLLILLVLTGCSPKPQNQPLSYQERTALYRSAIETTRDEQSNRTFPTVTHTEDDGAEAAFDRLNVSAEDMSAYALSVSCNDEQAYAAAAIYPVSGAFDTLLEQLRCFVCLRQQDFKQTMPDQYEIAVNTRLESLEDGTILLIMGEHQDEIFDAVRDIIERAK